MASRNVTRKGPGIDAVMRRVKKAAVTVGIHSDAGSYPDGKTVAAIGAWNEFGTETIPERPFLRSTFAEKKSDYERIMRKVVQRALQGKETAAVGIEKLGRVADGDVKAKIVAIRTPPNAESTKAQKKGVDNPLIDTGQLLNSVRYKVDAD